MLYIKVLFFIVGRLLYINFYILIINYMLVKDIRILIKDLLKQNNDINTSELEKQVNIQLIELYTKKINNITKKTYKKFWF